MNSILVIKISLALAFMVSVSIYTFIYIGGVGDLCTVDGVRNSFCSSVLSAFRNYSEAISLSLIPVLFLLPLKHIYFKYWLRFAIIAIPIITIFVYVSLNNSSNGFIEMNPWKVILPYIFIFYYLICFIIIIHTSYKLRKANKKQSSE